MLKKSKIEKDEKKDRKQRREGILSAEGKQCYNTARKEKETQKEGPTNELQKKKKEVEEEEINTEALQRATTLFDTI